jgi:hypothetical protein
LTADGDLCTSKLAMPTEFVGQNGAELHKKTKIEVQGCAKTEKAKHKKKAAHKRRGRRTERRRRKG